MKFNTRFSTKWFFFPFFPYSILFSFPLSSLTGSHVDSLLPQDDRTKWDVFGWWEKERKVWPQLEQSSLSLYQKRRLMDHFNVLISAENNQKRCVLKSAEAFQQFPPWVRHCQSGGLCFYLVCTNLQPYIPDVNTVQLSDINWAPKTFLLYSIMEDARIAL